jgi:hypothetical protein
MERQTKAHLSKDEMQRKMRKELSSRHTVDFQYVTTLERYLLSYEVELSELSEKQKKKLIEQLSPFDFLSGIESKDIIKESNLRIACENFWSDPDKSNDSFENSKRTIKKHIESITGKSLKDWLSGCNKVDTLKTFYLLFQLRIAHQRGLSMLANYSDKRYSEVEIFSHRVKSINKSKKDIDCEIIVLSNWLREFFIRTTWLMPENEKGLLKNLDLFVSGHSSMIDLLIKDHGGTVKSYLDELIPTTITSSQVEQESLSTKLMKHWQLTSHMRNSAACFDDDVQAALNQSYQLQYNSQKVAKNSPSISDDIIRGVSKILSIDVYLQLRKSMPARIDYFDLVFLKNEFLKLEERIYAALVSDMQHDITIKVKGIGTDGTRTSLKNTIKAIVLNNQGLIKMPIPDSPDKVRVELYDVCESHYKFLVMRANREWAYLKGASNKTIEDGLARQKEQDKMISQRVLKLANNLTLTELVAYMDRVNAKVSDKLSCDFHLIPLGIPNFKRSRD